jgi:hypothetical protein
VGGGATGDRVGLNVGGLTGARVGLLVGGDTADASDARSTKSE